MRATFDGPWLDLFEITIKNFILRIFTLGLYHPWARVNVRRFMWRHMILDGERFEFTGDGRELFLGFVKFFFGLFLLFTMGVVVQLTSPVLLPFWQVFVGVIYFMAIPFFIYSARRYVLSRTKWRGIRFGLSRVRSEYLMAFFVGALVSGLTLGLAIPWVRFRTHKILTDATMYGGVPLKFNGQLADYYMIHIKGFILTLVTLGIYYPWFAAELTRYNFGHTNFDTATLSLDIGGKDLLGLYLITLIVSVVTFGLAIPWATCYRTRYLAERFLLNGTVDFEKIQQMAPAADAMADSVVDYFDIDLGW